ncbi:hypothetical protein CC77DRAFT_1045008 [Alternaria alternata]|uniref:Uncharacterized protein n=1 Tax=Alternaria alternata TaxID=5599 RepID=A0A177D2R1_ALTAL|nr:hypothetical protein CC77DRAFT_1045008 [Alternaria alternata]OAG13953.1 hypothetical protein CC77DRAFT_1045008 [Alternaria alternata]
MTEDLVVCGDYPKLAKRLPGIPMDTGIDCTPGTGHTSPGSTFRLGLLADASIAIRREGSALEISEPAECIPPTRLLGVATDSRIPHGPTRQPSTQKLLNTLPSSIRSRASSLDKPRPLPFRWQFPVGKRYRVGDPAAFAAMKERNIEWYVTTGVLVEDCTGLRWNAGTYNYLLYWHVEGMPAPGEEDAGQKWLQIEPDVVRDWQRENWEADFGEAVMDVEDEPATPIVEGFNIMNEPLSPLNKNGPPSPSPSTQSDNGPESPKREKKVKFHRKKGKRTVLLEVDDEGVPVEEQGKIVETKVDETDVLSDNEGRSAKNGWGRIE